MYIDDTIAAIATPPGIGGVGIIRVSGKDSFPIVNSLFKSAGTVPLMDRQNRTIQYGTIVDPATNKTIDEVLVLLMKGPHSYTAEDVVEIQCHGGIVPVRQILKLLRKSPCAHGRGRRIYEACLYERTYRPHPSGGDH